MVIHPKNDIITLLHAKTYKDGIVMIKKFALENNFA